jgi:hypothetical protein
VPVVQDHTTGEQGKRVVIAINQGHDVVVCSRAHDQTGWHALTRGEKPGTSKQDRPENDSGRSALLLLYLLIELAGQSIHRHYIVLKL